MQSQYANSERFQQQADNAYVRQLEELPSGSVKVAIVYAVLYRFRMPIFRRISDASALNVKIFSSTGIEGTKLENAKNLEGINSQTMWTYARHVKSSSRTVPLIVNPTLLIHLLCYRPDVLLVQGGMVPNNFITLLYAKLTGTPIVWWSLGRVRGREFKGISAVYQRINRWIEGHATCYAGYSSESIKYFLEQGYPRDRCFNLVNVVDTDLVDRQIELTSTQIEPLRRKYGLGGHRVILFVGSVVETKKLDVLVKAFTSFQLIHQDVILLVVGDGPELNNVKQLAAQEDVADKIVFTGAIYENVAAYFQLGDLMVLPGTGGLAISEAMTHGLPIICSVGDGVEIDLIDEGVNGFIVEPGNVSVLEAKMSEVFRSEEILKEMGVASRNIIQKRANIKSYMNEMLSAISYAARSRKQ